MLSSDPRSFIDPETEAIGTNPPDYVDLTEHFAINAKLQKLGNENVIHFGGSLRDAFAGAINPRDYDFYIPIPDGPDLILLKEIEEQLKIPLSDPRKARAALDLLMVGEDLTPEYFIIFGENIAVLTSTINGRDCSIIIGSKILSAEEIAMRGDATVNCFAMSPAGEVFVHPKALTDLDDREYTIRVQGEEELDRTLARFRRINERYRQETGKGFSQQTLSV